MLRPPCLHFTRLPPLHSTLHPLHQITSSSFHLTSTSSQLHPTVLPPFHLISSFLLLCSVLHFISTYLHLVSTLPPFHLRLSSMFPLQLLTSASFPPPSTVYHSSPSLLFMSPHLHLTSPHLTSSLPPRVFSDLVLLPF